MSILRAALGGRLHRRLWLAALVFLPITGTAAWAQATCDDALREAQKSYELGLFEDVPGQLAPCLGARISRATAVQVHSLLARTYLVADDLKKARQEVSTILRLDSSFEPSPPPRFAELVAQVRREEQTVQVASVSKTKESLREAPATVIVITGEEIERRGYLDLEQILHDLPGFDISRTNGDIYSSIFQRGFFTHDSNRNLLLLDGVEQNDLGANILFLSRQYPLSSIDRIEIIYGPASTMYGANAYTGVINIITKEPESLIPEKRRLGVIAQVTSGSADARILDFSLAGKDQSDTIAWLLDGHWHRSQEPDLSHRENWDFSYDTVNYQDALRLTGGQANEFASTHSCTDGASPLYRCVSDHGRVQSVELTPEGERLARQLDRDFVRANHIRFNDRADDWSIHAKMRISNLTVGLDTWRTEEGISSAFPDLVVDGSSTSTQNETSLYAKYSRSVSPDLTFRVFTRYQQSVIDRSRTEISVLHLYANSLLGLADLVDPCIDPNNPVRTGCPANPWFERRFLGGFSNQIRSELTLVYEPSSKISGVAGLELTKSSIGLQDQIAKGPDDITLFRVEPEQIEHTDVALYGQESYRLRSNLKIVLAGRLSYNEINNKPSASGFGTLFSPRLAVIYSPGRFVFKTIYSEAFKDPSDFEKFGTLPLVYDFPSGGLSPEKVKNLEMSGGWQPHDRLSLDVTIYQANYSDVVALRHIPIGCDASLGCNKLQNHDEFRIRGVEASLRYRLGLAQLWLNWTRTAPFMTNPDDGNGGPLVDEQGRRIDELRVGDIASERLNLGVDVADFKKLTASLRVRYVGARKTGAGTTVANPLTRISPYSVADVVVGSQRLIPGTTLQFIVNNIFDKIYFDPGRDADSVGAPEVPQAGRSVFVRAIFSLSQSK